VDDHDEIEWDRPRRRSRSPAPALTGHRDGEVVEMVGKRVCVRLEDGTDAVWPVRTRVVIGDRVRLDDESVVEVLPRKTTLERSTDRGIQVVCANASLVVIVSSATDPPFRPGLVDRLLVAAEAGGHEVALVLNKCDLGMPEEVLAWMALYEDLGYPIFLVSATQEKGLEGLRALMARHTTVLVGHSGVGKTSLSNTLLPDHAREVGELDAWGRGRHTTISARSFDLPGCGRLVDLPGVREFGVGHVPRIELQRYFPELVGLGCKYRGCLHDGEDGCVAEEHITEERLDSYRKLLGELL
jgi:ribosome biogenesis GTPase